MRVSVSGGAHIRVTEELLCEFEIAGLIVYKTGRSMPKAVEPGGPFDPRNLKPIKCSPSEHFRQRSLKN